MELQSLTGFKTWKTEGKNTEGRSISTHNKSKGGEMPNWEKKGRIPLLEKRRTS